MEIIFIKVGIGKTLTIPIKLGYKFTRDTSKKYQEFISFFYIKNGKGKFSIKSFKEKKLLNIIELIQIMKEYTL